MAFILKDRVKETTTTTGTGAYSLGGSSSTFDAFQTVMSNADTTYYSIAQQAAGVDEWEVGLGTYNSSGNTLSRTTVLAGSNGTNPFGVDITVSGCGANGSGISSNETTMVCLASQYTEITNSDPGIMVLVRYKGTPISPISRISVELT